MNVTFLVGNGFDIGIGLKTRYEDFYNEYVNILPQDSEETIEFKKELISWQASKENSICDWADFEKAFGEYSAKFENNDESKWNYIITFRDFITKFNQYIEREEYRASFNESKEIAGAMYKAINHYYYIRPADKAAIEAIFKQYNDHREFNFVSFNYTRVLDSCVKILKESYNSSQTKIGDVLHMHGYIDENMIMGVNDPAQIKKLPFSLDQNIVREIVKPQQNIDARTNYDTHVTEVIKASNVICVYGMSVGCTDKKWWDLISRWLIENNNRVLIILKHDVGYNKRFPFVQREATDSIVNNFLSYSSLAEDKKAAISKRIFVGLNNDIFAMKLCPDTINVVVPSETDEERLRAMMREESEKVLKANTATNEETDEMLEEIFGTENAMA